MYSKTLTVWQWLRRRMMPRKPEDGGVGRRGQAVTDWSQSQTDHRDSAGNNQNNLLQVYTQILETFFCLLEFPFCYSNNPNNKAIYESKYF